MEIVRFWWRSLLFMHDIVIFHSWLLAVGIPVHWT
jgi:hypothetical protein